MKNCEDNVWKSIITFEIKYANEIPHDGAM
jgi:hypothetical protein